VTQPPFDQSGPSQEVPSEVPNYAAQAPAYPVQEAQPGQPPLGVPEAPKKKGKTGKVIIIVLIAVAVVVAAGIIGYKAIVGNRMTAYCQTYIKIGNQADDLNAQMDSASSNGDMAKMSDIMSQMVSLFDELRDSSPPDTVAPSLDTVIDYMSNTQQYLETGDIEGYVNYMQQHSTGEFENAVKMVDSASVEYCN